MTPADHAVAHDLVLRAARAIVLDPDGELVEQPAAVAVRDGLVSALVTGSDALDEASPAARWEAATTTELGDDVVLLPGLVDTHVHVNEPGRTPWEGFVSATRAAAAGGITTLVDMPLNSSPVTTTREALNAKLAAAQGKMTTDVAFWGGAIPENLGSLRELWDAGVMGFKCFLLHSGIDEFPALDRDQMVAAMREIAAFDGLLIVHAEDPDIIDAAPDASGRTYDSFLRSRPEEAEHEAIAQIIDGVRETGCRTHVLHLSAASALPMIRAAKDEGLPLTVETCPHYLSLVAEAVQDGSTTHKCCPPIREAANREGLWRGLADGTIDIVVSDHSPCTPDLKRLDSGDFGEAWGGIASVQLGLPIVWTQARLRGIPVTRVVEWMARRTAHLVGLDAPARGGARGVIAEGARADFAVLAPDEAFVVLPEHLHHKNAITAYAGEALAGRVRTTYLAGEVISTFDAAPDSAPTATSGSCADSHGDASGDTRRITRGNTVMRNAS